PARLRDECFEYLHVVGVGAARGPPGGVGLEREPELGELLGGRSLQADERREGGGERRLRRARGVRAAGAARADVDDPERLERPQRLADGRSADLEAFREVALVRQARALGDLADEDRVPNLQEHVVERPQAAGWREG